MLQDRDAACCRTGRPELKVKPEGYFTKKLRTERRGLITHGRQFIMELI